MRQVFQKSVVLNKHQAPVKGEEPAGASQKLKTRFLVVLEKAGLVTKRSGVNDGT